MRVVDTSAWIEWMTGSRLGSVIAPALPPRSEWIVPTIVQLELMKWLLRESGEEEADKVLAYSGKCRVVALDTEIAIRAAQLHRRFKLATADAIVYATALEHDAEVVTCDAHFKALPGVLFFDRATS